MDTQDARAPAMDSRVEAMGPARLLLLLLRGIVEPMIPAEFIEEARSAWHDAVAEAYVEGALSAEQANVMWAKNPYR